MLRVSHSLTVALMTIHDKVWPYVFAAFLEVPVSQVASRGEKVMFGCRHSSADTIRWKVNSTLISGSNPPTDITPGTIRDENNHLVFILTIVARPEYNQTQVVCVARFDDGLPDENTAAALLHVTLGGRVNIIIRNN